MENDAGRKPGEKGGFLCLKVHSGEGLIIQENGAEMIEIMNAFGRPTAHLRIRAPQRFKIIRIQGDPGDG